MPHVKNQHIVPQFLLKNFSSDGLKIWSFDKTAILERWNNTSIRSISTTPTEKYIYDKIEGSPNDSLEYYLGEIENMVSPIIDKLIEKKDLNHLNSKDKLLISKFISSQMKRTKREIRKIEFLRKTLADFSQIQDFLPSNSQTKSDFLNKLEKSDELIGSFLNKSWNLAISEDKFYISDEPVVRFNSTNKDKNRGTLGLESKGIEIYLPISSSVILILRCSETFPESNIVIEASLENIEFLNWLQINYSNRFIYSKKSDFALIYDMINKNEL